MITNITPQGSAGGTAHIPGLWGLLFTGHGLIDQAGVWAGNKNINNWAVTVRIPCVLIAQASPAAWHRDDRDHLYLRFAQSNCVFCEHLSKISVSDLRERERERLVH